MVQRQWEEEYEIHMYSGGGEGGNGFYTAYFQAPVIYSFEKDKMFDVWMFQRQCNCIIHHCTNIYMKVILVILPLRES